MSAASSGRFPAQSNLETKTEVIPLPNPRKATPLLLARPQTFLNAVPGAKSGLCVIDRTLGAKEYDLSPELVLEAIRLAPLFANLSHSACAEIAAACGQQRFVRGGTVFCEDDPVQFVFVITSGRIKITQLSRSGKEVILGVEGRGDVVDAVGLSSGKTHLISAQAIEEGSLLSWDLATFDVFTHRYQEISRNATRILGERLRSLQERFRDIATERVPQRLARLLLSLLERKNKPGRQCSIDFSQEELAQMTGTTLFTVSRVLCQWASQGIIQPERKAIVVESLPGLVAVAQETGQEF